MESLKLDNTQNRNLTFFKIFGAGLLMLWGVHFFSAEQQPDWNAQKIKLSPAPSEIKTCQMSKQKNEAVERSL